MDPTTPLAAMRREAKPAAAAASSSSRSLIDIYSHSKWLASPVFIKTNPRTAQESRESEQEGGPPSAARAARGIFYQLMDTVDVREIVYNYDYTDPAPRFCINDGREIGDRSLWRHVPLARDLTAGRFLVHLFTCGSRRCTEQFICEQRLCDSGKLLTLHALVSSRVYGDRSLPELCRPLRDLPEINPNLAPSADREPWVNHRKPSPPTGSDATSFFTFVNPKCQFQRAEVAPAKEFLAGFWDRHAAFWVERNSRREQRPRVRLRSGGDTLCFHDLHAVPAGDQLFYRPTRVEATHTDGEGFRFEFDVQAAFCGPACCKASILRGNERHPQEALRALSVFCSQMGWRGPILAAGPREMLNRFRGRSQDWGTIDFFRGAPLRGIAISLIEDPVGPSLSSFDYIHYPGP